MSDSDQHTKTLVGSTGISGMSLFAELVQQLGTTTKTNDKLQALRDYFLQAPDADKVWVIAIFSGRKPRRAISSALLSAWCMEITGHPSWLFTESYHTVGDLAETISLLLPEHPLELLPAPATEAVGSTEDMQRAAEGLSLSHFLNQLLRIEKQDESVKKQFVLESWSRMTRSERFVFNKLITGSFRIGVSQKMMVNALSRLTNLEASVIAHRISGNWDPATTGFDDLLDEELAQSDASKPYPFYLAYALETTPHELGEPADWQAEWKWDGIRGQLIKREGQLFIWSRGEELVTEKFIEYHALLPLLPDGISLDGEILPYDGNAPLSFNVLQTRIGRKNITRKHLSEAPIVFFVYDLLEYGGEDFRSRPLSERRLQLEEMVRRIDHPVLQLSPIIDFQSWDELIRVRESSRDMGSEGLMLKRKTSSYQVGRKRGDWWKWKIDPLTIDAVLVYAQKGSGRRSNLYTDYTFAVRDGDKLVTFTKAYSGLTDKEFGQIDHFIKRNSLEKFGPVRTVKPELVFELAFEGIAASNRHKSGVALRFPRMLRWRKDKTVEEINTLDDLKNILEQYTR